jgi:hypothetical protein
MSRRIARVLVGFTCSVFAACGVTQAQSGGTFSDSGNLNINRSAQSAVLLTNGKVLIAGGSNTSGAIATAELYNPANGTFTESGSLVVARFGQTATLLNNGNVLLTGGYSSSGQYLAESEVFNVASLTFTATGSMATARESHTASLLPNGTVLIAGGYNGSGYVGTAEIYNPSTGTFSATGNLNTARSGQTATVLNSGSVLLTGGDGASGVLASSEVYSPATATFTVSGNLNTPRDGHSATLLNNGTVLIAAGNSGEGISVCLSNAELYNPTSGVFTYTGSLVTARVGHTATLLSNGTVLISGGDICERSGGHEVKYPTNAAEIYNGSTFAATGNLNYARAGQTTTLILDEKVLVAGGSITSAASELYNPTSLTPSTLTSITLSPTNSLDSIGSTMSFTATGSFTGGGNQVLASAAWTSSNTTVATITSDSSNFGNAYGIAGGTTTIEACAGTVCGSTTMTVAPHQNVILGSEYNNASSGTYEIYNDSGTRTALANHSTVLLKNGNIFVAGGSYDTGLLEILSVATGQVQIVSTGTLLDGRDASLAVLTSAGNVFIAGGMISPGTWELYSPTGSRLGYGNLNGTRQLKNGNIWISGSAVSDTNACTWEIRSPSGSPVSSGNLNTCFGGGKGALLSNGDVILMGGDNAPGTYEIYTPTGVRLPSTPASMTNGFNHGSTLVSIGGGSGMFIFGSCETGFDNPGDPYFIGSCASPLGAISTWEYIGFDANGNKTFDVTNSLENSRSSAKATVLSNGNIFITGGQFVPGEWEMWLPSGSNAVFEGEGSFLDARYAGHSLTRE